jgi:hypothetical protein
MYEPLDVNASRKKSTRARNCLYPPVVVTFLCAVVIIILLSILLARPADVVAAPAAPAANAVCNNALTANAALCDQTTDCLRGFSNNAGDACTYYPRPSGTANCSAACYARPGGNGTRCDGAGACVGDAAGCVFSCQQNADCTALFEFNLPLLNTFDPVTFWTWGSWYNPFGCLYGRCTALVLDIFAGSSANALFTNNVTYAWTPLGALTECKEYLEPSFRETYKECLTVERYLLDPSIVRTYNLFSGYANSSYPFQMSTCIFTATCAPLPNPAAVAASSSNVTVQTQEQWGFHVAAGSADAPTGPLLGLRSLQMRSDAWSLVRDTFAAVPPGYFDVFLNQPNLVADITPS